MNVLVTGATSAIGSHIAAAFASGNHVFLVGRNARRLSEAAELCRARGAHQVTLLESDLNTGAKAIFKGVDRTPIHLFIHAASSLSRLRDEEIPINELADRIRAEVLTPVELVQGLLEAQTEPMALLFISSILAVLPTPRRSIYGRLKGALESSFLSMQSQRSNLDVRILRISKVIDTERPTADLERVAAAAARTIGGKKKITSYGNSGRLLSTLYQIQPVVFRALMDVRRLLQDSSRR